MSIELSLFPSDEPRPPQPMEADSASLYRAYRSLTFAEVAGQRHVTQTLRNAVRYGKVAHAYLFTGPRGTGKTSTARILARAVNCLQPQDGEPCNSCEMCQGMLERRSLDLVEIDGASNNSVDDVRELRDRVSFRPAAARRKVFIIDEVHMLSIGAFNALLKTLEEPPEHVLFVLATTEIHKVPATVTSRCQIFHLRPIPTPEMLDRLRYVCHDQGMEVEDGVLSFVVGQSTGSLRDALSLLEQIRAFCGDVLCLSEVEAALGLARTGQVAALAEAMAAGNLPGALLTAGELIDGGIDPRQLTRQLIGYWRDALIGRARKQLPPEPHVSRLRGDGIFAVLRSLLGVESATRRSDSPRWALELAIAEATLALGGDMALPVPVDQAGYGAAAPPASFDPADAAVAELDPAPELVAEGLPPPAGERLPAGQPPAPFLAPAAQTPALVEAGPPAAPSPAQPAALDTAQARERWPAVLRWLNEHGKENIMAYLGQTNAGSLSATGTTLTIAFPASSGLTRAQLERPNNRALLEQAVGEVFGGRWSVRCVTIEGMAAPPSMEYMDGLAVEFEERGRERRRR